jgi:hypothetical protein
MFISIPSNICEVYVIAVTSVCPIICYTVAHEIDTQIANKPNINTVRVGFWAIFLRNKNEVREFENHLYCAMTNK